jgi:hypothetical protein
MPHDLPPKSAAYYYFAAWRDDGTDEQIHDLPRWQVREKAGRAADPTPSALDRPWTPRRCSAGSASIRGTGVQVGHDAVLTCRRGGRLVTL